MTSVRLKDTTDVVRRPAWVGATEPTSDDTVTVGPGTLWIDDSTTPNVLKRRNDADDGWVAVGLVTGTTAVTAAPGNHNHTHDSLTGRTTDNHHAKAHNAGDAAAHPDVLVTSPATGDALVYDATAAKWKNVPVAGGVTLSSANPTTAAPSDAAAPGTGLSASHGDHRHGMPATWPPTSHAHSSHSGLGADDHTQYQLRSERGSASGYAPLDSGLLIPVANLGTGTPTGSKFLRDDRTWAVPAGSGGGSLTIEEVDGTPSVASATKLILPSGTVSVTGTEATYTPAGGGGSSDYGPPAYALNSAALHGTYGDDFTGASLDAKWTRQGTNMAAGRELYQVLDNKSSLLSFLDPTNASQLYLQTAPAGDFELVLTMRTFGVLDQMMIGLVILDVSGNGVGASTYNSPEALYLWGVTAYAYASTQTSLTPSPNLASAGNFVARVGMPWWLALNKTGTAYKARFSGNGKDWSAYTGTYTSAITVAKIGFGRIYNTANFGTSMAVDRFNVV